MASEPLQSNTLINADHFQPPPPADPELVALAHQLLGGHLKGPESVEARLRLLRWLANGNTVVFNCVFIPGGAIDVRANSFIVENCPHINLLASDEMFAGIREANVARVLDAPLPSETESPVIKGIADWFQGLRT